MVRAPRALALGGVVAWVLAAPGAAVVCSDGSTAFRNTSSAGLTAGEIALWDQLGTLNGFYVTPVSASHVLAARHIGGSVGNTVSFGPGPNQGTYTTTGFEDDPSADLRLWQLDGPLASWVPIYSGSSERDSVTTVFGKGGDPGPAVMVDPAGAVGPPPAHKKGWVWGTPDGLGSWGENVVDRVTFVAASGLAIAIDLDRPIFGGLAEECQLSGGDSSGPWFIEEAGVWYLAGVSSLVSGPFQHDAGGAPDGQPFEAMLFDKGGLWENDPAFFNTDQFTDVPSSGFAVRISSRKDWLLPLLDSDGDGVGDDVDNCTLIQNPAQDDTDGDGYGNACDGDFNGDGVVNGLDFFLFLLDFASGSDSGTGTDMDGNGAVNGLDYSEPYFIAAFSSGVPGPSAP